MNDLLKVLYADDNNDSMDAMVTAKPRLLSTTNRYADTLHTFVNKTIIITIIEILAVHVKMYVT